MPASCLTFLIWLAAMPLLAATESMIKIEESRQGGSVVLRARNLDPVGTQWVWVEPSRFENVRSLPSLPRGLALKPGEEAEVARLGPISPGQGWSYGFQSRSGLGDPGRQPDKVDYLLPYEHGTKQMLSQGYFGRYTHQDVRALDFQLPQGTRVCAARDGVVVEVKEDGWMSAPSALLAEEGNRVIVQHADASWAMYAHLKPGGALVRVGERVNAGQALGLSGETGMASGPHLHFAVYRADWDGPKTLATTFKIGLTQTAELEESRSYYAYHPGGAAFKPLLAEDLDEGLLRSQTRTASPGKVEVKRELIDRRTLVYASNGTARPVELELSLAEVRLARASQVMPYKVLVPARTEVFCFWVDFVGGGESSFRLATRWRERR